MPRRVGIETLRRPNAWLSEIKRLAALLDMVYSHTTGEIWLFDNDLKVLEDSEGSFELLYKDRVDGSLASRIRCVKILLRPPLFDRFCDRSRSPQLYRNLCSLHGDRLSTFFIGRLDEHITPSIGPEFGGQHPWIFYLGEDHLQSSNGIVIVRPNVYPFSYEDGKEHVGIAWKIGELGTLRGRLTKEPFEDLFVKNYQANFQSVVPEAEAKGKVAGYHLEQAKPETEINAAWTTIRRRGKLPVLAPVDCAIITTLNEEFAAVSHRFKLTVNAPPYATGWHISPDGPLSIVLTRCLSSGSVCSAITTARLIHEWKPKSIFLVGRCGGWRKRNRRGRSGARDEENLQVGDVIVADYIFAYEYQALKRGKRGTKRIEYDVRPVRVSGNLVSAAQDLIDDWHYRGRLPGGWEGHREPITLVGTFACGCKLIRRGAKWFEEIMRGVGRRKIIATEMEGEGVGATADANKPAPDFLMIKGISDFANPQKGDQYKDFASETSADFLFSLLSQRGIKARISGDAS